MSRRNLFGRRIAAILAAALLQVLAIGCQGAGVVPTSTGIDPSPSTSSAPTGSAVGATAEEVDIGGRALYLECRGSGEPTILFLHGAGGDRTHGHHLLSGYADRHRVCVYDRANMGLSDAVEGSQSGADVVDDLTRMLEAADVPEPYLLVANSFGGIVAELYAADQPEAVAGMVLVDASLHSDADVDRWFADRGELDLEQFQEEYESEPEHIRWTIHDEARAALERIPDVPITYLRAVQESGLPPEAQEIWNAGLTDLLARSANGRLVDVEGPHALPPPPVHEAIDEMLKVLNGP